VGAVLIGAAIPAIYFPVVNNKKHVEPRPAKLMSKSVNGAIDFFNKKAKTDDV
jgi:hypothetical protein